MASSIQSAGQPVQATSGASTTSKPRRKATRERVCVRLNDPAEWFAPLGIVEGHQRGQRGAFLKLQQALDLIGPRGERADNTHQAWVLLSNFIATAGAAFLAVEDHGGDRTLKARKWAAYEALRPMVSLVLLALPHANLAAWQRQEQKRLEDDDAWIARVQSEERARFVERMREGRARARARRAQGGAA